MIIVNAISSTIVLAIVLLFFVFSLGQLFYCLYQVNKYRKLANIERKYIYEKYGIWIEEPPAY
jgi:hypothetical protein